MKVSTIVISTVSALSMAGALGIAYAQSTYTEPQPGTSATTSEDPSTMNQAPSGTASPDSSSTMSQDATGTTTQDSTAATQDSSGAASQDSTAASQDSSTTMSQDATSPAPAESTDSATPRSRTYNERVARADRN